MIYLTPEDREKLTALDQLLRTLPTEYIKELSEADEVVSRLKGEAWKPNGFIQQLVEDNIQMSSTVMQLQADVYTLRDQLKTIIKIMSRPAYDFQSTNDLNMLKSSLGVY